MISKVLQELAILPENEYSMDETGILLNMLGSVKFHVGRDDVRKHRGASVKRIMVTAMECINSLGIRGFRVTQCTPASTRHR